MTIEKSLYGALPDGRKVTRFTVTNGAGLSVSMMDYGCTLLAVDVPDKAGKTVNVTLSFDGLAGYLQKPMYAGTVVGRFANRIAAGKFTLDGREYPWPPTRTATTSTAGRSASTRSSGRPARSARPAPRACGSSTPAATATRDTPGTLKATVVYALNEDGELSLEYLATTDKATPGQPDQPRLLEPRRRRLDARSRALVAEPVLPPRERRAHPDRRDRAGERHGPRLLVAEADRSGHRDGDGRLRPLHGRGPARAGPRPRLPGVGPAIGPQHGGVDHLARLPVLQRQLPRRQDAARAAGCSRSTRRSASSPSSSPTA